MTGFEPATPRTPCVCATRLRHIPKIIIEKSVGVAGFEPATSCSQSRRDDRATLHPEEVCKYSIINTEIAPYYFEIQKLHSKNLY